MVSSCSPNAYIRKTLQESTVLDQNFSGFYLYDPLSKKVLFDQNGDHYFTPASNTKLFTFYAGLKLLGDSVPSFSTAQQNDSLILWPAGDPTFLHPELDNGKSFRFLQQRKSIYVSTHNFQDEYFGPGWSWDDYNYAYSAERSSLPIYGNVITLAGRQGRTTAEPQVFNKFLLRQAAIDSGRNQFTRRIESNLIDHIPSRDTASFERRLPFRTDWATIKALLEDTLNITVETVDLPKLPNTTKHFSVPVDSIYRPMLQDSDNFLAEQILLMAAESISDTINSQIAIQHMKKTFLADLPDEPMWVDGSGLSRYNLFTPRSLVSLLEKIYQEAPRERLFALLPAGGESGTIRSWYQGAEPYVFAKTGTLRNNHCLSGYLVTAQGKVLIFSFMHNNYVVSSSNIKREMQKILAYIQDKY